MSVLGMPNAFDYLKADFSNFCNTPTFIGLMKQVAKIKLDEEGTEAAAVTVIGMDNGEMVDEPILTFHANHPFLYVISEKQTGAIFFIGQFTGC
jgi:serpin B